LNGWQQQANQNADDGDNHQQFNQRESTPGESSSKHDLFSKRHKQ
jgi:hypothetical protein